VFDVPPVSDKAMFSGSIFDAWWKPLEDIGLDGADAGKGSKYLVLPPDYQGAIPDGFIVLHSRTYRINELFRVVPAEHGEPGWNAAVAYAKTLKVYPLSDAAAPKHVAFVDVSGGAFPGTPRFDRRYFEYVNQIVQEEPVFEYDKGIVGMAASLGIEKGKPFQPDERMGHILDHAAQGVQRYSIAMMMTLKGAMMGGARFWPDRHWVVPGLTRDVIDGGAQWVFPNRLDYVERASFYYFGVGVPKRSGTRGIYMLSTVDAKGAPLNGSRHYRLRLPKDVPAKDFWEVIAYSVITRSYIDTPANRIDVSSAVPTYKTNNDGSIDIYLGPTPPPRREANWISTRPEEPYEVTLRFYGPQQRLVEKQWVAGDIEEIAAISASGGRALH
jgi:hypothetical protein